MFYKKKYFWVFIYLILIIILSNYLVSSIIYTPVFIKKNYSLATATAIDNTCYTVDTSSYTTQLNEINTNYALLDVRTKQSTDGLNIKADIDIITNLLNNIITKKCSNTSCVNNYTNSIYNQTTKNCSCISPFIKDTTTGKCVCPFPKVLSTDGSCICPTYTTTNSLGICACPDPTKIIGSTGCVCPSGQVLNSVDNKCYCNNTMMVKDSTNKCVCPAGTIDIGAMCACSDSTLIYDNTTKKCIVNPMTILKTSVPLLKTTLTGIQSITPNLL